MEKWNTLDVISRLRYQLEPVARAESLVDVLEGYRPQARKAAVLLCLFDQEAEPYLAFIRRATTLRLHSGEIAFPGGGVDPGDSSLIMAALREAREEIGLNPSKMEVLGILPPVFTGVSNYLITPVVAFLPHGLGDLQLQTSEVTEMLFAPLRGLADPSIMHTEQWTRENLTRTIYFYDYDSYRVWGATARILYTLLGLLNDS